MAKLIFYGNIGGGMTFNSGINCPKLVSDGQLFIGNSSGLPLANTITPGAGISITNGNGNITISSASSLTINDLFYGSSVVYTPSSNLVFAFVQALGGGGAGGGCPGTGSAVVVAGGGGGGGYASAWLFPSDIGGSQNVTVGLGGVPVSGDTGNNGGTSSFGSLVVAQGGFGGVRPNVISSPFAVGGSGGTYSGGAPDLFGAIGQTGGFSGPNTVPPGPNPVYTFSGFGGGSFISQSTPFAQWVSGSTTQGGFDALTWGVGGAGALVSSNVTAAAGGFGFQGYVRVTEFISSSSGGGGGGGITWIIVSSNTLMAPNFGYVTNSSSQIVFTLPTVASVGSIIRIAGIGSGGWQIVYGSGQQIIFGTSESTVTTGNITSTEAKDCIELVCTQANNIFEVLSSVGNPIIN